MPPTSNNANPNQATAGTVDDPIPPMPFPSLTALRTTHNTLLDAHRTQADRATFWPEVERFIERGRATGALLDNEEDRWAAQSLLDYWSATGYSVGRTMPDAALADFDPTLAPEIPDDRCPYVGLAAFREFQEPYFFGRRQLVESLLAKVATERLIAVVGPSGSGKSSIVLAGLLPALKTGGLAAQDATATSDQWRYSERMVPGSDPLANLERAILPKESGEPLDVTLAAKFVSVADGCRREPDYLVTLLNETGQEPFVLVIDQFEELFTLCTDDALRRAFINNLLSLIQAPGARHTVLLTMRTDFESFVARLPDFLPYFEEALVRVTPLNAAELRDVIERPAALVGLKFETGVVDALVQDVLGEPAALPLLQFTLLKLWERRDRNRITWASYKELGGGRLALSRSADQLYDHLIPEEQLTARRILLRLVRPGEGLEITSNRVRRSVLYQTGEARDRVDRVLARLVNADLLRLSPGDKPEDAQIEVAHEALVRNWPRLVGWLEDERGRIRERLRLTEAAEQWLKLDRDPSALLRGTLLEDAQRHPDLNELEEEFVAASLTARQAADRERELVHQRELEQARVLAVEQQQRAESETQWAAYQTRSAVKLRRRAWLLGITTVVALLLSALAVLLGYRANEQALEAQVQEATAVAAQLDAVAQAATADAERDLSESARATAEAERSIAQSERAIAQTAVAGVRAEQTRVQHLEDAFDYTAEQLSQLQQDISAVLGTPVSGVPEPNMTSESPSTPTLSPTPVPTLSPMATLTSAESIRAAGPTARPSADGPSAPGPSAPVNSEEVEPSATPTTESELPVRAEALIELPSALSVTTPLTRILPLTETAGLTATVLPTTTEVLTSAPTLMAPTMSTPTLIAMVPDIDVELYTEPSESAAILQTIRAPLRLPVIQADSFWAEVMLESGETGWVQAWLLTYQGDASQLPLELRYLVVSEATTVDQATNLPYTYGTVISVGGATEADLLNDPNAEGSVLLRVPVGTDVTLLFETKGPPSYGSGLWYFVSILDPAGQNLIWRGYLPAEAMVPR